MNGAHANVSMETTTFGDALIGCADFSMRIFRGRGREGIRVCGSNVLVEDFYIEAIGVGDDHADGFQSYAPGTRMTNVTLRRGNIIVTGSGANAGIFLADHSDIDITLEHIRVDGTQASNGGLFFANVPGDIGVRSLRLNDVLVVGGRYRFEWTGGLPTIHEWTNVRDENGVAIPRPQ